MRTDNYLGDFCDGSLFKGHTLFQIYTDALQFILHFDELEVCNPLGSHSGVHKLGIHIICSMYTKCTVLHVMYIIKEGVEFAVPAKF